MPSAEHLKEKQAVVDEIKGKLDRAQSAVVIDYIGITVAEADAMRKTLREADVDYTVYKNTLVKRAVAGTDYARLEEVLSGPSAFAISYSDAVAPARVLNGIFKEYKKMEFKAGVIEGAFYDAEGLKQIAALPTRDELIARFLGSVVSPIGKLVRTFKAIADAGENGKPAEAAPEPAVETPAAEAAPESAVETPAAEAAPEPAIETPAAEAAPEPAVETPAAEAAPESAVETPEI
ncbi:MAG: 50S ribosomal protein L10 [Clostridiales Family XIII bacterium]|jgi:large subunit ribosomal protein L10|nr:50S ribosomal protein L10 [Clostridiales Family XIII bacterium]